MMFKKVMDRAKLPGVQFIPPIPTPLASNALDRLNRSQKLQINKCLKCAKLAQSSIVK